MAERIPGLNPELNERADKVKGGVKEFLGVLNSALGIAGRQLEKESIFSEETVALIKAMMGHVIEEKHWPQVVQGGKQLLFGAVRVDDRNESLTLERGQIGVSLSGFSFTHQDHAIRNYTISVDVPDRNSGFLREAGCLRIGVDDNGLVEEVLYEDEGDAWSESNLGDGWALTRNEERSWSIHREDAVPYLKV